MKARAFDPLCFMRERKKTFGKSNEGLTLSIGNGYFIGNGLQRGKKANQPDLRRGLRVEGVQEPGTVALLAFL